MTTPGSEHVLYAPTEQIMSTGASIATAWSYVLPDNVAISVRTMVLARSNAGAHRSWEISAHAKRDLAGAIELSQVETRAQLGSVASLGWSASFALNGDAIELRFAGLPVGGPFFWQFFLQAALVQG